MKQQKKERARMAELKKENIENKKSKLELLKEKKRQIENQIKTIQAKEREKERKARTRRLIQNGALVEKYLNCENIEPADLEQLLLTIVNIPEVKALIQQPPKE